MSSLQLHEVSRFWAPFKDGSQKLTNPAAGITVVTGDPFDGGALSVVVRAHKPDGGYPYVKMTIAESPENRSILVVQERCEITDGNVVKQGHIVEMRRDPNGDRFLLRVTDGAEIDERDAPQYFVDRARYLFEELNAQRGPFV